MDDAIFRTCYEAVRGPLLAYLRHGAGDGLAEDLFQEACIRLLATPPRDTAPGALRRWLFTTASRLLHDHWRKDRPLAWWPWGEDAGDGGADVPACPAPLPDQVAWTRQAVELGFAALTPRQRALLWLAHVEGFDHHELGRALRLSPGSARVLLHRARQSMVAALNQRGLTGDPS